MVAVDSPLLVRALGCTVERAERFAGPLAEACDIYEINTPERLAAFLAQIGHESASLRFTTEIWGPTPAQSRYEGRADLGNTQSGDGSKYRGHGLIQTTGRHNHARVRDRLRERYSDAPDFEANPEALAEPRWAALSAADYWDDKGLNALADAGHFEQITRLINGGLNGLADRVARLARARRVLETDAPQISQAPAQEQSKEPAMPIPLLAIASALLPNILAAAPALTRIFSASQTGERNARALEKVAEIVTASTGSTNVQEGVEKIETDPEAAESFREAVEAGWFELVEVGGGVKAARAADTEFMTGGFKVWQSPAFIVSLILLLFPLMLMIDFLFAHPESYSGDIRVQIVTAVLVIISLVGGYWIGTSYSSSRKTELNAGAVPR